MTKFTSQIKRIGLIKIIRNEFVGVNIKNIHRKFGQTELHRRASEEKKDTQ